MTFSGQRTRMPECGKGFRGRVETGELALATQIPGSCAPGSIFVSFCTLQVTFFGLPIFSLTFPEFCYNVCFVVFWLYIEVTLQNAFVPFINIFFCPFESVITSIGWKKFSCVSAFFHVSHKCGNPYTLSRALGWIHASAKEPLANHVAC